MGNITRNNLSLKVGSGRANQFGYKKRKSLQKHELILDKVGHLEKIYETQFIIFVIGYVFDSYECTSRKIWLILQNSTYGIEKIEMKNMSQCKEQGKQYTKSSGIPRYLCLIGK